MLSILIVTAHLAAAAAVPVDIAATPIRPSAAHAPTRPPGDTGDGGTAVRTVEMHVGIPGLAYIGQTMKEFLEKFPNAKVTAFANQKDAFVIQVPGNGISAYAVGASPEELKLASVGFVLDQAYQGVAPGRFRSDKGIAKGSTVNDLLEAYGQPSQISGEGPRRKAPPSKIDVPDDPKAPKKYEYARADGAVTTYFVVQENLVTRIVVNHLAPLDHYVVKRRPEAPPAAPAAPPPGP